jgi:hypothetical protein
MADTQTLPEVTPDVVITTEPIMLSFEPISKIAKSVSTQSVDIDILNSLTKEVLTSYEIELGIIAPNAKTIERTVGKLIGGCGFLYQLIERRDLRGFYTLTITSLIGPLQIMPFATALQAMSRRVTVYVEGNLVPVH